MLLTAVLFVVLCALLINKAFSQWYVFHAILLLASSWFIENHYAHTYPGLLETSLYTAKWVLIAHLISINIITSLAYIYDKKRASRGGWRVAENSLLGLILIGGTPSAIITSRILRHKTSKKSFRDRLWLIIIIQIVVIIVFLQL